jgi:acetyltransferase-like isoleucine patch superfamily enzyme
MISIIPLPLRKKILKLIAKQMPGNGLRIKLLRLCNYSLGKYVYIGEDLIIIDDLSDPGTCLAIGDRASISPRVTFVMHTRPNNSRIASFMNSRKGAISIGADAWIGTGAVILPDVVIGEGAVVGANSVVTKSVPPYTVVGGVPAHFIKKVEVQWIKEPSVLGAP